MATKKAPEGRKSLARGVSPWKESLTKGKPRQGRPSLAQHFQTQPNTMPQSFTCLHYHLIFSTKHRLPTITKDLQPRLYEYFGGVLREHGSRLVSAGGMPDHVHLLVSLNKQLATSDALRLIKSNSSKWIHETYPELSDFNWQDGYAAFAVSYSSIPDVKRYLVNQAEHHCKKTFQEEFVEFLKRHEIEYDVRYLWD